LSVVTGELYTWGKGGPRLGYESSSRKEILPRFVEGLEEHRVVHVACGRNHTLGKLMTKRFVPKIVTVLPVEERSQNINVQSVK